MFLGYQNDKIVIIAQEREELENIPLMSLDRIEETWEPVELINGTYYVGEEAITEIKKKDVHAVRNHYLEIYIDPVVSNPFRWADMSEKDQNLYINYRLYLLDYTKMQTWWEQNPLTFDEWKEQNNG